MQTMCEARSRMRRAGYEARLRMRRAGYEAGWRMRRAGYVWPAESKIDATGYDEMQSYY